MAKAGKAPSLWGFGGIGPVRLGKRVWHEMSDDDVYGKAAELSYYFLLALFPALLFVVSLLGFFAGPGTALRQTLFQALASIVPQGSSELVSNTVNDVSTAAGTGKLTFGILTALWAASGGMSALISTLNGAYEVKETRPWWKVKLRSIALTITLTLLIIAALTLVLFGGHLGAMVTNRVGLAEIFQTVWNIIQWPIVLATMLTAFATIYYYAPNIKKPGWHWVSPGAVVGVTLWLAISFAFRLYLQYFNTYSKTYGSLGAVIILMLWFYMTGLAVLVGGEVNSEIGHVVEEGEARKLGDRKLERDLAA